MHQNLLAQISPFIERLENMYSTTSIGQKSSNDNMASLVENEASDQEMETLKSRVDGYWKHHLFLDPAFEKLSPDQRYQLALFCANKDAIETAITIRQFHIIKPEDRLAIARICAKKATLHTASHFQRFEIHDASGKYEIAMLCAREDRSLIARNIENFHIDSEEDRFEIAKFCGFTIADNFKNFRITDPNRRHEIAKACAQYSCSGTEENFRNFEISNQDWVYEIAKICARRSPQNTAKYFRNFKIADLTRRFKIARICAQEHGGTLNFLRTFNIKNTSDRFEIALHCAQQNGQKALDALRASPITDQEERYQVARYCLRHSESAHALLAGPKQGDIPFSLVALDLTPDRNVDILLLWNGQSNFDADPEEYVNLWRSVELPEDIDDSIVRLFTGVPFCEENLDLMRHALETAYQNLPGCTGGSEGARINSALFHSLLEGIFPDRSCAQPDSTLQLVLCKWLRNLIAQPVWRDLSAKATQTLAPVIRAIFNYRNPAQRLLLNHAIGQLSSDSMKKWRKVLPQRKLLPNQLLASFSLFRLDRENSSGLQQYLFPSNVGRSLKSGQVVSKFVGVCDNLFYDQNVTSNDAISLLELAREAGGNVGQEGFQRMLGWLVQLDAVISLGHVSDALRLLTEEPRPTLDSIFCEILQNALGTTQTIDGLRYLEVMNKWRTPDAILIYAGKIKQHAYALESLGKFITALLEENWPKIRYEHDQNWPEEMPSETRITWERNSRQISLSEVVATLQAAPLKNEASFSEHYFNQLKVKLVADGHLNAADGYEVHFPALGIYLKDREAGKVLLAQLLGVNCKSEDGIERARAFFQVRLIDFAEDPTAETLARAQMAYEEMTDVTNTAYEFGHDLTGWMSAFSARPNAKNYDAWQIALTDDAQDLILSGTEVAGSCQNIHGSGSLNRGLIVSTMDPRLKTLVIKNGNGKIMGRRFMRLVDHQGQAAVLLERQYPDLLEPELEQAMMQFARDCAKDLKCALIIPESASADEEDEAERAGSLDTTINYGNLTNPAYIDSAGGFTNGGEFTLQAKVYPPVRHEGFDLTDRV